MRLLGSRGRHESVGMRELRVAEKSEGDEKVGEMWERMGINVG